MGLRASLSRRRHTGQPAPPVRAQCGSSEGRSPHIRGGTRRHPSVRPGSSTEPDGQGRDRWHRTTTPNVGHVARGSRARTAHVGTSGRGHGQRSAFSADARSRRSRGSTQLAGSTQFVTVTRWVPEIFEALNLETFWPVESTPSESNSSLSRPIGARSTKSTAKLSASTRADRPTTRARHLARADRPISSGRRGRCRRSRPCCPRTRRRPLATRRSGTELTHTRRQNPDAQPHGTRGTEASDNRCSVMPARGDRLQ